MFIQLFYPDCIYPFHWKWNNSKGSYSRIPFEAFLFFKSFGCLYMFVFCGFHVYFCHCCFYLSVFEIKFFFLYNLCGAKKWMNKVYVIKLNQQWTNERKKWKRKKFHDFFFLIFRFSLFPHSPNPFEIGRLRLFIV